MDFVEVDHISFSVQKLTADLMTLLEYAKKKNRTCGGLFDDEAVEE